MRVLTVGNRFPPASHGGYERLWVSACQALVAAGHAPSVLTTTPADVEPGADALWPWPVARELRWWWRDERWRRPLPGRAAWFERRNAAVLERHLADADAVLAFNLGGLPLSLLVHARAAGVPVVGVVGDLWPVYGRVHDPRSRDLDLAPLGRWIAISRWVADRAGLPAEVVHPGVDLPDAVVPPGPPRTVLVAGRLDPRKGADVAVRAVAELPGTRLVLDGPGDPAPYERLARDVGAQVEARRSAPEAMPVAYAEADAVLFPVTWEEPWGLVPLEAMAAGRPVVATATGGAAEYLRDGENALVVAPGDPAALAAAVRRLEDHELRARLVAGGRATAARYPRAAFDAALVAALESIPASRV